MRAEPPHRPGTFYSSWGARDFEHCWTYNIEEFYNYSGDPWIKDDMAFWCEYFKTYEKLYLTDSTLISATRGVGHTFSAYLMAIRITNGSAYLASAKSWVSKLFTRASKYNPKFSVPIGEGPFQLEFMDRSVASFMQMNEGTSDIDWQRGFQFLWGHAEWNTYYGNYCYYWQDTGQVAILADTTPGGSGGSFAETMAYMAFLTQHKPFVKNLKQVWNTGNNMYMNTTAWNGDWMGRWVIGWSQNFRNKPGLDTVAPLKVTDLSGTALPWGVRVSFTPPADAKRFHVVWGYKPIKEGPDTLHLDTLKWWQAFPGGVRTVSGTGPETCTVTLPIKDTTFYFAVRTFDSTSNISPISNAFSILADVVSSETPQSDAEETALSACPTPFNPGVMLRFTGAAYGKARSIRIYNAAGVLVRDFSGDPALSAHSSRITVRWNAGAQPSGIYFVRAIAGKMALTRKIVLAK
jgi:hypothetical protein